MNPTETIREIIPSQGPVGSTEISSSPNTEVEAENINVLAQQKLGPNTQNPQTISAIKNGTVKQKTGFYGAPGQMPEIAEILFEKSKGEISTGYGTNNN